MKHIQRELFTEWEAVWSERLERLLILVIIFLNSAWRRKCAARRSKRESLQYYMIARGSLSELDTQVELCGQLNLLESSHISHLSSHVSAVDGLSQRTIPYNKTNRTQQRPP